jgi:hypothetical protein
LVKLIKIYKTWPNLSKFKIRLDCVLRHYFPLNTNSLLLSAIYLQRYLEPLKPVVRVIQCGKVNLLICKVKNLNNKRSKWHQVKKKLSNLF